LSLSTAELSEYWGAANIHINSFEHNHYHQVQDVKVVSKFQNIQQFDLNLHE
jgi:hypothetical protein